MSDIWPKMSMVLPGEYCNDCPYFKPDVMSGDLYDSSEKIMHSRIIICENEKLCYNIHEYLKRSMEEKHD